MRVVDVIKKNRELGLTNDPQFAKAHRRHDWRNYVPDSIREMWKEMSVEARVMVYLTAKQQSDLENWDN